MKKQIKTFIKSIPALHFLISRVRAKFRMWYYARMKKEQYPQALKRWYRHTTGETLDLENPKTFNEKIQWLKLYDNIPIKTMLADKYQVRQWVAQKIGEEYLIPLLGVWQNADDIDFGALPDQFVLKANHGSGWNVIVKDKNKLNLKKTRKLLNHWLKLNYAFMCGLELSYKDIPPVIIAEQYIENMAGELFDYRFLCFDGEPKYCWVDTAWLVNRRRAMFNLNFELQPFTINTYPAIPYPLSKPENFDQMVTCAKKLCEGFKHVRVDLYDVNGKIYFAEMTFTAISGTGKISPPEYAKILGDMINL